MDFRIILTILSLFVFAGCTSGPVCNKPYMWVGNDCCLDKNDNKICDKDETTTTTTFMTPTTSTNQDVSTSSKYTVSSGEGDDSIRDNDPVYHTGFVKMQPIESSIIWRNQNFEVNFSNMLEDIITLKSITLEETITGHTCTVLVNPTIGQTVKAGGTFTIKSSDCPVKADEDSYDWIINIQYIATQGGITTTHTDSGHIKYNYRITEGQQELGQKDTSGGIQVISVSATNGQGGNVQFFEVLCKLSTGSDPLALNDTMINFDTKNSTQQLTYNTSAIGASTTQFGATWVKTGPDYLANYLTVRDIVRLNFTSTNPIGQSQTVKIKLIPKRGVIVPVEFVTPNVISTMRVSLYP